MGLFRKKESVKFRDEDTGEPLEKPIYEEERRGKMVRVEHGHKKVEMKSTRQLEREYYEKHPEKRHPTLKKIGAGVSKLDKKIVDYNRRSTQRKQRPAMGFDFNPPSRSNANPFGSMFDTGLPRQSKPKKTSSKTKYTIISGKAYPIAGTGAKKKTKKRTIKKGSFGFDPFNNSEWL